MKKACVIGWPIQHSRSPLIHNYWIKKYKIDALYERHAVEPSELKQFISSLHSRGFAGCNVTIPHKETVLQFVEKFDEKVAKTGSLNTIYFKDGKICATSTDGQGFLNNVLANAATFNFKNQNIMMIGAGGSAKAICERLIHQQVKTICIHNRTAARVAELQSIFGDKIQSISENGLAKNLARSDMLINTTSQGMVGQPQLSIDLNSLPKHAIVADIVYVPLKTNLILKAENLGLTAIPGLGMLLHQAVEGFNHWFGVRPEVTIELHNLIAENIRAEQPK